MAALAGFVLASGCRQLNESHCGNQDGNATCSQRSEAAPYCDYCSAVNDGCAAVPPLAGCGEASSGPGSTTAPGEGSTTAATAVSSTDAVDSSSTGEDLCGNGMIDEGELCDGEALPEGANCMDEGFGDATPGCVADCSAIDYTDCPEYMECGNNEVAFGEECDGMNLNGNTCGDFPNLTGEGLVCSEKCTYDTGECMVCREHDQPCDPDTDICCDEGDICAGTLSKRCCTEGTGQCLL